MKKKLSAIYGMLVAAFCVLLFTQCKKSDNVSAKSKLLVSTAWKYKAIGIDNGAGETPFPIDSIKPCYLDNTIAFKTDTSGVLDEGATKCDPTKPQNITFKYTYNTSTNILNLPSNIFEFFGITGISGINGEFKVRDISSTQLKLSKDVPISAGSPTTVPVIVTLVH